MFACTFEATSYLTAVHKARVLGLFGDIVPVRRNLWVCYTI